MKYNKDPAFTQNNMKQIVNISQNFKTFFLIFD